MKPLIPNRWLRSFAYAFVAFVFTVAIGAGSAFAQVYVTPDGDDIAGDGSQGNPFESLGVAANAATDGQTIFIGGGSYTPAQVVDEDKSLILSTFEHAGIVTATFQQDVTITGEAVIDIQLSDQTLVFNGALIVNDATVDANGDFVGIADLTVDADGVVNFSGDTVAPSGDVDVAGEVNLAAGTTFLFDATQTVSGGGEIGGDGDILISGDVTLTGDITFGADLTLAVGGDLDLGANTLTLLADFENEPGSGFNANTGTVTFAGEQAQMFWPRGIELYNFEVLGEDTELTTRTTLRVHNDITIGEDALVNMGQSGDAAVHIRLLTAADFVNEGGYTTPTDVAGFIIVEHGGVSSLEGDGVFGNLDVRDGTVELVSDINFSGTLMVGVDGVLDLDVFNLTITDDFFAVSDVTVNGEGAGVTGDSNVSGTFAVDGDALYNLTIHGNSGYNASNDIAQEGLWDLSIVVEDGNNVSYNGPSDFEVAGVLTINDGTALILNGDVITLTSDDLVHEIGGGFITLGALLVTGDNVTVNGTEDGNSFVEYLEVDVAGGMFTSNDIKEFVGVTITAGNAVITMHEDAGSVAGLVVVSDGSLTLDMGDEGRSIGSLAVEDGDFTLASDVTVNSNMLQEAGNIDLGAFDLIVEGNVNYDGPGEITATSGYLVVNGDHLGLGDHNLSVVNLMVNNVHVMNGGDDAESVTVTGAFVHTAGTFELANDIDLIVEGSSYTYVDGDYVATSDAYIILHGLDFVIDPEDDGNHPVFVNLEIDGDVNFIQAGEDQDESRNVTVSTHFHHTSGHIALGAGDEDADDNNLIVQGEYVREAGTYGMDNGYLVLDGALDFTPGADLSVPNLAITGGVVTLATDDVFTVTSELFLDQNLLLAEEDQLVVGNGVTITVNHVDGVIDSEEIIHGDDINVVYNVAVTAGFELPEIVRDLTINAPVTYVLAEVTVTGTLTLDAVLTTDDGDLTVAEGASIVENITGSVDAGAGDVNLPDVVTSLTLGYIGDETDSQFFDDVAYELLLITGSISFTGLVDELTVNLVVASGGDLTLAGDIDIIGDLTVEDTGDLDVGGFDLAISRNLTLESGHVISGLGGSIIFNSDMDGVLDLDGNDWEIPAALGFVIDKDDAKVTLTGGDLDFLTNSAVIDLVGGVLITGSNVIHLDHVNVANQGFTRTDGHIKGHVRKNIPNAGNAADYARVIFPVGTENPNYRPLIFNFEEPSGLPAQAIELTVSHHDENPQGSRGLSDIESVTKYPEFFWRVETDLSTPLSSNYMYQVQAEAEGYMLGDFSMDEVSLIRRAAGPPADNSWNLTATSYDNEVTEDLLPIVRGLNTTQLLRTHPRLLTFGIPATIQPSETMPDEIFANLDYEREMDVADFFDGVTGDAVYTVSSADEGIVEATLDGTTLTLTGVAVGSTTLTVSVEDETGDSGEADWVVTVNDAFLSINPGNQGANLDSDPIELLLSDLFDGGTLPYSIAVDSQGDDVATLTVETDDDGAASVLVIDNFTAIGRDTITVVGTDAIGDEAEAFSFVLNVGGVFMAVQSFESAILRAGDGRDQVAGTLVIDTLAAYYDGGADPITISAEISADTIATVDVGDGTLSDTLVVTALASTIDGANVDVVITAIDGAGVELVDTLSIEVLPAFGDVNADGSVASFDATQILRFNVEDITFTAVQEDVADVTRSGTVSSFDASVILRYFVEEEGVTIPFSPQKLAKAGGSGSLSWGESVSNREEGTISVPLMLDGTGVYSLDFHGEYDNNQASIERIEFADLPDGWLTARSNKEGQVRIAMAGSIPARSGKIATVVFKLEDNSSTAGFQASGLVNDSMYEMDRMEVIELPEEFALKQNYPNPFNPTTNIIYQLPVSADVTIEVYNTIGQRVLTLVNQNVDAGTHTVNADFSSFSSGMYIYRIVAQSDNETFTETKKMTLIK